MRFQISYTIDPWTNLSHGNQRFCAFCSRLRWANCLARFTLDHGCPHRSERCFALLATLLVPSFRLPSRLGADSGTGRGCGNSMLGLGGIGLRKFHSPRTPETHTSISFFSSKATRSRNRTQTLAELGLDGKRMVVTVLTCQMRDFIGTSEEESPEAVMQRLNGSLSVMMDCIGEHLVWLNESGTAV